MDNFSNNIFICIKTGSIKYKGVDVGIGRQEIQDLVSYGINISEKFLEDIYLEKIAKQRNIKIQNILK